MNKWLYLVGLAASFAAGCAVQTGPSSVVAAQEPAPNPAYMIISIDEIHPDQLGPFKQAVRPIVQEKAGGAETLAVAQQRDIQVLEGTWDNPGLLIIERFKSMEALKAYWYSDEYAEVKKLREGHAKANFFVAIEGRPLAQSGGGS